MTDGVVDRPRTRDEVEQRVAPVDRTEPARRRGQRAHPVDAQAERGPDAPVVRDGHVDRARSVPDESVRVGGGGVAEGGVAAGVQESGTGARRPEQRSTVHDDDARVNPLPLARLDATPRGRGGDAVRLDLRDGQHAVLPAGERHERGREGHGAQRGARASSAGRPVDKGLDTPIAPRVPGPVDRRPVGPAGDSFVRLAHDLVPIAPALRQPTSRAAGGEVGAGSRAPTRQRRWNRRGGGALHCVVVEC